MVVIESGGVINKLSEGADGVAVGIGEPTAVKGDKDGLVLFEERAVIELNGEG